MASAVTRGHKRKNVRAATVSAPSYCWAIAGATLGLVMGAGVFAPASWLAAAVDSVSEGRVRLLNPTGRIWAGSAALELSAGRDGTSALSLPSRLSWQLGWQGRSVVLELAAECCTAAPVQLRMQWQSLQISSAQLRLPVAWLQALGAPWNTLRLRGDMRAQWEGLRLAWTQPLQTLNGAVHVQLHQVSTSLSTLPDIGSYQFTLTGGETPRLQLSTLRGALQLSGQGQWHGKHLRFQGQGQAQPDQVSELSNLLTLLGRRQGNTTMIQWG